MLKQYCQKTLVNVVSVRNACSQGLHCRNLKIIYCDNEPKLACFTQLTGGFGEVIWQILDSNVYAGFVGHGQWVMRT